MGHRAFGMSLFYMGNFVDACDHLRAAIELYDATPLTPLATVFSQDQKATAQAYLALAFILRGDIRRGLELGHDAAAYASVCDTHTALPTCLRFWPVPTF